MKLLFTFLVTMLLYACADSKEITYVGSTPAHPHVRNFFGISLTDSIDFIRWKLIIQDNNFTLNCEYGVCKPSTNGFLDGKKVELMGKLKKENNHYYLPNGNKTLALFEINTNLLHILNADKKLLIGNGGWSYSLNNTVPRATAQYNFTSSPTLIKDSVVLEGRTPCQQLSALLQLHKRPECNKMKWLLVLYLDASGQPTNYIIGSRAYKRETTDGGKWKIVQGKDGRIIYQLEHPNNKSTINLLKGDEHVLFFTDAEGNLLAGNEDFSYTLNRRK